MVFLDIFLAKLLRGLMDAFIKHNLRKKNHILFFLFYWRRGDSNASPAQRGCGKTGLPVPPSGGSREIAARRQQSPCNKGEHPSIPPASPPGFGKNWDSCCFPAQPSQGEQLGLIWDGRGGAGNLILGKGGKTHFK